MSILVVIEQSDGGVHRMSREAIAAGQALGRDLDLPVSALLLGNDLSSRCETLQSMQWKIILFMFHKIIDQCIGVAMIEN